MNSDTVSIIRAQKDGETMAAVQGSWLHCNESLMFYVSWEGGRIEVGRTNGSWNEAFLLWTDPSPRDVNSVGMKTINDVNAVFHIRHDTSKVEACLM